MILRNQVIISIMILKKKVTLDYNYLLIAGHMSKFFSEFKSYIKFKQETGFDEDGLIKYSNRELIKTKLTTPNSGRSDRYKNKMNKPSLEKGFLNNVESTYKNPFSPSLNKLKIKKVSVNNSKLFRSYKEDL